MEFPGLLLWRGSDRGLALGVVASFRGACRVSLLLSSTPPLPRSLVDVPRRGSSLWAFSARVSALLGLFNGHRVAVPPWARHARLFFLLIRVLL